MTAEKHVKLYCVVPFYNEAAWLPRLCDSLIIQSSSDISFVFVDNNSTDNSVEKLQGYSKKLDMTVIQESQKGTGAASDAGFRYAIKNGATHIARLDADCAPDSDWVERVITYTDGSTELLLGQVQCSKHDPQYRWYDSLVFTLVRLIGTVYGRLAWRGPEYKVQFYYGIGNNFVITKQTYEAVGGFEHTAIDDADEDGVLFDKVRRYTNKVRFDPKLKSNPSLRRIRRYGYVRTMLHYWGRRYKAPTIDVR